MPIYKPTFAPVHVSLLSEAPGCKHPKCVPEFDVAAADGMKPLSVRECWPRFYGECPDCKAHVVVYASMEHYEAGYW